VLGCASLNPTYETNSVGF